MNEKQKKLLELLNASDQAGRTALGRIPELWRQRTGREYRRYADVITWLCSEFNFEREEARGLNLNEVADLIELDDAGLAARHLNDTDREIVAAVKPGEMLGSKEIADRLPTKLAEASVRRRLQPGNPLARYKFIEKGSGVNSYHLGRRRLQDGYN